MADYEIFELGDVGLQSGITLRQAKVAYKTYGKLAPARDNVIVMPTFYGGQHADTEPMMQAGRALDPDRYFIIVPNMLGNGLSSSPSNTLPPFDRAAFPNVTVYDNVVCQHRLVTQHLGISRIKLVVGFSMGAQQAFQWGALYSDIVQAIAPLCGSARTSPHNYLFLDGVKAALLADAAFADGWYQSPPIKLKGYGPSAGCTPAGWPRKTSFANRSIARWAWRLLRTPCFSSKDISGGGTRMICWRCCGRGSMLTSARTLSIRVILLLLLEPSALARS